jgi:hypothetical protein
MPKLFPIIRPFGYTGPLPKHVDWSALNEEWAQRNHGQSLVRLAERGGLVPCEIAANMERRRWRHMEMADALKVCELFASTEG